MASDVHQHQPDPPDLLGQLLSAACVVHCAAMPLVMALAPAAAAALGGFHPLLLVLVLAVAAWAFVPGFRRHRRVEVLSLGGAGVALLAVGTFVFEGTWLDVAFSVAGASVMMVAHWRNRRLQRACCAHP